ncbi:unnamed protein product [Pleuronectes platessa]|uniref:Uncharacterized protein n=1 Tax=Pleuronectes platessa TaxID=8262 RepID=A0A9N7TTG8_PLEPL|nr:unnamed protein product [Pleuronectes platessa]
MCKSTAEALKLPCDTNVHFERRSAASPPGGRKSSNPFDPQSKQQRTRPNLQQICFTTSRFHLQMSSLRDLTSSGSDGGGRRRNIKKSSAQGEKLSNNATHFLGLLLFMLQSGHPRNYRCPSAPPPTSLAANGHLGFFNLLPLYPESGSPQSGERKPLRAERVTEEGGWEPVGVRLPKVFTTIPQHLLPKPQPLIQCLTKPDKQSRVPALRPKRRVEIHHRVRVTPCGPWRSLDRGEYTVHRKPHTTRHDADAHDSGSFCSGAQLHKSN